MISSDHFASPRN